MRSIASVALLFSVVACASSPSETDSAGTPQLPPPMFAYPETTDPMVPLKEIFDGIPDCAASDPAAIVAPGVASIAPGQTLCLSFELDGGYFVPQVARSLAAGVVILSLASSAASDEAGDGEGSARLTVFNPFRGMLKYRAGIRVPGDPDYYATSSCPVMGGGFGSEFWPHPVDEILVAQFHVLPEDGAFVCQ
jgi:hypothetical protein